MTVRDSAWMTTDDSPPLHVPPERSVAVPDGHGCMAQRLRSAQTTRGSLDASKGHRLLDTLFTSVDLGKQTNRPVACKANGSRLG